MRVSQVVNKFLKALMIWFDVFKQPSFQEDLVNEADFLISLIDFADDFFDLCNFSIGVHKRRIIYQFKQNRCQSTPIQQTILNKFQLIIGSDRKLQSVKLIQLSQLKNVCKIKQFGYARRCRPYRFPDLPIHCRSWRESSDYGQCQGIAADSNWSRSAFVHTFYSGCCVLIEKPIKYDCRMRPIDINTQTGTKDLQTVTLSLRVLQHPISNFLPQIHQELGRDYQKKIFFSVGQEVIRTVVAQYDADQLLKFREDISKEIKTTLTAKAKQFHISVEDVSFMHLAFSREYAMAIEHKAVQQQLAEKQKFVVSRDEQLKLAQIIRSEAEADAAHLINNAVSLYGSAQIEIKRLEAAKIIAESLSRNPNISFIPEGTNNLLNLRV